MIEVEAKVRIENPEEIKKKSSRIARFVGIVRKHDDYYTLEDLKKYPMKSIRVRKKKGVYEINIKKSLLRVGGVHAKREFEFAIKDAKTFIDLIKDIGFRKWLTKEKVTYNYEISKQFHIEINKVKHLGWFLEVEYLAKRSQIPMARSRVLGVIKEMGFDERDIVVDGYTKILWDLRH